MLRACEFLHPPRLSYDLRVVRLTVPRYQECDAEIREVIALLLRKPLESQADVGEWARLHQRLVDWFSIESLHTQDIITETKALQVTQTARLTSQRAIDAHPNKPSESSLTVGEIAALEYSPLNRQLNLFEAPGPYVVYDTRQVMSPFFRDALAGSWLCRPRGGLIEHVLDIGSNSEGYRATFLLTERGLPQAAVELVKDVPFHVMSLEYGASTDYLFPVCVRHARITGSVLNLRVYDLSSPDFSATQDSARLTIPPGVSLFDWRTQPLRYFPSPSQDWPIAARDLVARERETLLHKAQTPSSHHNTK